MSDVETKSYKITGLVDIFDDQNNITGQYPVGSVQVLPVDQGERAIAAGQAEDVEDAEDAESTEVDETEGDDSGEGEDDDELDGEDEVE